MTPRDIVQSYLDRHYQVVMWEANGDLKGPIEKGWPLRPKTLADYRDGYRVGLLTGVEVEPGHFLHDVDIDWAPGSAIAKELLPETDFIVGRESKRWSHCFYTLPEALVLIRYEDLDKTCLIELRGTKKDGDIGFQTMVPPSMWSKESRREQLGFERNGRPTHEGDSIRFRHLVCLTAIGMILAKRLGVNGFGHEVRLAWAGFLLRLGVKPDDLIKMGEGMSAPCNNLEVPDVRRVVESTASALAAGGKVKGGASLAKLLGRDNGKTIIARIREWLGAVEVHAAADLVVMRGGDLSAIVDRAEAALVSGGTPLFQRGGVLVRPVRLDTPIGEAASAVRRDAGSLMLYAVREPWLLEEMGRVLRWARPSEGGIGAPADPESKYARTLLARGQWTFPALRGIVAAPTLARDGRILDAAGLDIESGLLVVLDSPFPSIPDRPTDEQARAALDQLAAPLRGFPFVDDAAKSVALSAMLTALVRMSLRTAPLHGFDAPTAGTGKSMLAEIPGLLATGCRPPALSQGKTPEEDEKRLSTVLFAGDPVIHLDNCERPITGDFLCSMLSQEVVQARILGLSERRILPSTALVLASGNNLTFAGDASRRAVICRLDAGVERPDTRAFDFDCHAEVLAARPALVVAGLTILRAYVIAGRPEKLTPMGSFTDWEWIRGALVWLGCADPADTRAAILDSDPRKDELVSVMDAWETALGAERVEVAEIEKRAEAAEAGLVALRDLLVEVACRSNVWSGKSAGKWLARYRDKVVAGRSFRSVAGTRQWRLDGAKDEAADLLGSLVLDEKER